MSLGIVILAAGNGARMASARPKVLHDFAGQSMVQRVVDAAKACAPSQLAIVHAPDAAMLKQHLAHEDVMWIEQEKPLGTGHAVLTALPSLSDCQRIMVLFADAPCLSATTLQAFLDHAPNDRLGVITAIYDDPGHLGRIVRDADGTMAQVVEYADATDKQRAICEVFTGVVVAPRWFLEEALPQVGLDNKQGEYYLPDILAPWAQKHGPICAFEAPDAWQMRGVNSLEELSGLERQYQRHLASVLQASGVRIMDPNRFDCRGTLVAKRDVTIGVNVEIEGHVEIQEGAIIESGVFLKDVKVGVNSVIKRSSVVEGCVLKDHVVVGPFAHLRPGCVLDDQSFIGPFVQIKNTHMGKGAKAGHLAYVGDSEVGVGVNIGAGVVTCNYDGNAKHTTKIGDGAFIGSGSYLVAPVLIGKKAFVGAGTVVRKPVSDGSLVVDLPEIKQVEGWGAKRLSKAKG